MQYVLASINLNNVNFSQFCNGYIHADFYTQENNIRSGSAIRKKVISVLKALKIILYL